MRTNVSSPSPTNVGSPGFGLVFILQAEERPLAALIPRRTQKQPTPASWLEADGNRAPLLASRAIGRAIRRVPGLAFGLGADLGSREKRVLRPVLPRS
jgi:hypothetical protein